MQKVTLIKEISERIEKAEQAQTKSLSANESIYHRAEKETLIQVLELVKQLEEQK